MTRDSRLGLIPFGALAIVAGVVIASVPPAAANHAGDDWLVILAQEFLLPNGSCIVVEGSWEIWAPWPLWYNISRMANVEADVNIYDICGVSSSQSENIRIQGFGYRWYGSDPTTHGSIFQLFLEAAEFKWDLFWTVEGYDGCLVNKVVGHVDGGTLSYRGQVVSANLVSGVGIAHKSGPGADGGYECYPGNLGLGA